MLVQCENCGAPLDVSDERVSHVACAYCGASNKVRSSKTLAAMTPQGWTPPPQWQPPQQGNRPAQVLVYRGTPAVTSARRTNAIVGIVIAVVMGAITIGAVVASQPGALDNLPLIGWDGREPFRCGSNDRVTISGVTANLPNQTAIVVEENCEVEIVDSHIAALEGIRADGNRRVVVRNSTIVATRTGITADGNKEIELENSTVDASGVGVAAGGNVTVTVIGGRVSGPMGAVTTSANATVDVRGGQLVNAAVAPPPPVAAP
jgi:hypothetical protein